MRAWLLVLFFVFSTQLAQAKNESRAFDNANVGKVMLSAPGDWEPIERHHINFGTTFYRLDHPSRKFDFEILVNDLEHMQMGALVDEDLEKYIESNMEGFAAQSVEGVVRAVRFGEAQDGVYARIADKSPAPGEWRYFTQGVRLLGRAVVLFTLYSNDANQADLSDALGVVESVKVIGK